jgi:hypothetical protein
VLTEIRSAIYLNICYNEIKLLIVDRIGGDMDAIRKIVNSDELVSVVDIPKSLSGKRVELIILPVAGRKSGKTGAGSGYGILKQYANPDLIATEDSAWANSAKAKHAVR